MRIGRAQRGDAARGAGTLLLMVAVAGLGAQQTPAAPAPTVVSQQGTTAASQQEATAGSQREAAAASQPEANAAPEVRPYVLHVYQNLMQIPTVVVLPRVHSFAMSQNFIFEPVTGLSTDRFQISLDSGSNFAPKHMHVEGNEPITLAIVVDMNSHLDFLIPSLAEGLRHMITKALLPHDHVSLYTVDCELDRWSGDLPANSPQFTPAMLNASLGTRKNSKCGSRVSLFDSMATVVHDLSSLPGRRVMVVISRGDNHGGTIRWPLLRQYAAGHSTAIFGVVPLPEMGTQSYNIAPGVEDPFDAVCEMTGGLRLTSGNTDMEATLMNLIDIVRQRYILEFSRPDNSTAGEHAIDVTIAKLNAMVRPGGIAVPLADPTVLNDPTTVKSAPSNATYGKRKPLKDQ